MSLSDSPHPDDLLQYLKSFMIDDEYLAKFGRDKWEDATKEILDQVNRYKDVNAMVKEWKNISLKIITQIRKKLIQKQKNFILELSQLALF